MSDKLFEQVDQALSESLGLEEARGGGEKLEPWEQELVIGKLMEITKHSAKKYGQLAKKAEKLRMQYPKNAAQLVKVLYEMIELCEGDAYDLQEIAKQAENRAGMR